MEGKFGQYAFIVGVTLAILAGLASGASIVRSNQGVIVLVLVILGLVIGFLNVTEKEMTPFLIATVALIVTGTASNSLSVISYGIGDVLQTIVKNIAVLVTPAALVVSLKVVHALAKD